MPRKLLLFVFVLCAGSALAQTDSLVTDSLLFDFGGRFYNIDPCGGCPGKFDQQSEPKMFMENPYKYKNNNPIVLPDSLVKEFMFIMPSLLPHNKKAKHFCLALCL